MLIYDVHIEAVIPYGRTPSFGLYGVSLHVDHFRFKHNIFHFDKTTRKFNVVSHRPINFQKFPRFTPRTSLLALIQILIIQDAKSFW